MSVSTPATAGLTRATSSSTGPTAATSGILSGGGGGDGAFVGGGQIGYNWQSGAFVYGLETDIQYVGLSNNVSWGRYTWWEGTGGGDGGYFGTVRARLGYAIDRTLIYITGGLAYGGLNTNPLTGNTTSNVGWTLGGGVEYAFTNNWTAKIEGLYVDTGEETQHQDLHQSSGRRPSGRNLHRDQQWRRRRRCDPRRRELQVLKPSALDLRTARRVAPGCFHSHYPKAGQVSARWQKPR